MTEETTRTTTESDWATEPYTEPYFTMNDRAEGGFNLSFYNPEFAVDVNRIEFKDTDENGNNVTLDFDTMRPLKPEERKRLDAAITVLVEGAAAAANREAEEAEAK
jgi:hypothetical protein